MKKDGFGEEKPSEERRVPDAFQKVPDRLLHDAFHDELTGLANRAQFMNRLELALEHAKRHQHYHFAVLFLDLDSFKLVNDCYGYVAGDELLARVGRRLSECLRPGDTMARVGGDEFAIHLDDVSEATDAVRMAEWLQEELALPFAINGHKITSTVSIGIAISTTGYDRAENLLLDADNAMCRAKTLGNGRYEMFDATIHARAKARLQLELELKRAVERHEFRLHYQPIISLENGTIKGFEALVRWQHPERGLIHPPEFISVAEATGLILEIDRWVLSEACHQLCRWQRQSSLDASLSVSVNLSGKHFTRPDLIEWIIDLLRATRLDPRCLEVEITESAVMENIEMAASMLAQLSLLGMRVSADDFGTGYSSLTYVHHFPLNALKIDRSFVDQMVESLEHREIVRTIIMLARNLNMQGIAEGVETEEQLTQLRALKCQFGQGYLFSRPVDEAAAEALLHDSPYHFTPVPYRHVSQ